MRGEGIHLKLVISRHSTMHFNMKTWVAKSLLLPIHKGGGEVRLNFEVSANEYAERGKCLISIVAIRGNNENGSVTGSQHHQSHD